jgi:hypothetical protein
VVIGALVLEKEATQMSKIVKQQYSVCFISEVLTGSKKYYSEVENICYAVVMSARKLTNQLLNDIFGSRDTTREELVSGQSNF